MKWEIISIGDEVLKGHVLNRNTTWISSHLNDVGFEILRQTVVGDQGSEIQNAIKEGFARSSFLIMTGGLGPTLDDGTKNAVSDFFQIPMVYEKNIASDLEKRFPKLSSIKNQSTIIAGAKYFLNLLGTAPGLLLEKDQKILILLPGVFEEMKMLFKDQILPYLIQKYPTKKSFEKKIYLGFLHEVTIDPFLRKLKEKYPEVNFGIYPSYGRIEVKISSENENVIEKAAKEFIQNFSEFIFSFDKPTIAKVLHEKLLKTSKKIAFAESCTGGALAKEITALPGASHYFLGSVVSYANELKEKFLHVSQNTLKNFGAVSEKTVEEMLVGLFHETKAHYGIAISGVAGPSGGTQEKPVGTVFIAIGSRKGFREVKKIQAPGNRATIIEYSVHTALFLLWKLLVHEKVFL